MHLNIYTRIRNSFRALFQNPSNCLIKLDDKRTLDITNNRLIIEGDFELHSTGNMKLSCNKHLILQSGCSPVEYENSCKLQYSVWYNPTTFDKFGNPTPEEIAVEQPNGGLILTDNPDVVKKIDYDKTTD